MPSFTLDHLDDTAFEEFCSDLLGQLDFVNITWRKGTGLPASPADRGRDIECERIMIDPVDGSVHVEKWFVQCKHYKQGVPPEKLIGALTWSSSAPVDWLLIIVSNYLSNPAKDFIEDFKRNRNPHLKVKIWEKPELERLTVSKVSLLRKYNIPSNVSFISIMHPAHIMYIQKAPLNTLDYFFDVMDGIDADKRNSLLSWVYNLVIMPRRRKPVTGNEKLKDLYIDEVSYDAFKKKCYAITDYFAEMLLVHALVSFSLSSMFNISDKTKVDDRIEEAKRTIDFWKSVLAKSEDELVELESLFDKSDDIISRNMFRDHDDINKHIEFHNDLIRDFPSRTESNYSLYLYFCEHVIDKLLLERVI